MVQPASRLSCLIISVLAASFVYQLGNPSPSFAWSPLQYDTQDDVDSKMDGESVMTSILRQMKANHNSQNPDAGTPASNAGQVTPVEEKPQATSAGDNSRSNNLEPQEQEHDQTANSAASSTAEPEPAKEIKSPAKVAGHQPTEKTLDPDYYLRRARSYAKDNDLQSALNYINKALELSPECWEAWYEKGLIYQLAGKDGPAARRYLELIKHRPDMLEVHIALGALYRKHHNYDLAEAEYKTAIDINYYSFESHYNFANLLMEQTKLEQALKEYKVCLKLQPTNALVHNNIGVIYEKRQFLEEAAEEFTRASHLDPANAKFADNLNQIRSKLGQKPSRSLQM